MRLWETPVPIPNTTVKTQAADGTALETVWESRWMPDYMGMSLRGESTCLASRGSRVRISSSPLKSKDFKDGLIAQLVRAHA